MGKVHLYRTIYLPDMGYVVYRYCFDESKCSLVEGARAHRQATFVDEISAVHYCRYRNRLVRRNGSDAIFVPTGVPNACAA